MKGLKGSHNFDVPAGALDNILCQHKNRVRVFRSTTDCGSNFIKTFTEFGEKSQDEEAELESDKHSCQEPKADYLDSFSILERHRLNLPVATDAVMAKKRQETFKRLSHAAFGKHQEIWNKSGLSYMAAETVENEAPADPSQSDSVEFNIFGCGENHVNYICEEFKVKNV